MNCGIKKKIRLNTKWNFYPVSYTHLRAHETREDARKIDFDDSFIYSELKKNMDERKISMIQIMRNEALKAFELWDKKTDKVKY